MPELSALRLADLRLVKVPDAAPPYDCQVHGTRCPAPGVTATADAAPAGPAAHDEMPWRDEVAGREAAAGREVAAGRSGAAGRDRPVPPAVAGDPATARPRQLALVIVEVLAGVRPDRQLVPLATDRVRARIRSMAPLLASDRRPRVARILTSRPASRVVEMTVVADFGPRSRALAMRFEHVAARPAAPGWPARPARWLCTVIEAG